MNISSVIKLLEELDAEDVRDSGYFYMNLSEIYDGLNYNRIETQLYSGIRIDKRGHICPFIGTDEGMYIIEEMTPYSFASKFKTLLSYQNKNIDIDEVINNLFRVIELE